jgi:hypothetical protein
VSGIDSLPPQTHMLGGTAGVPSSASDQQLGAAPPSPAPLTEADVRRIVREELQKAIERLKWARP